jgi:hypothetical protein
MPPVRPTPPPGFAAPFTRAYARLLVLVWAALEIEVERESAGRTARARERALLALRLELALLESSSARLALAGELAGADRATLAALVADVGALLDGAPADLLPRLVRAQNRVFDEWDAARHGAPPCRAAG